MNNIEVEWKTYKHATTSSLQREAMVEVLKALQIPFTSNNQNIHICIRLPLVKADLWATTCKMNVTYILDDGERKLQVKTYGAFKEELLQISKLAVEA
jgi:hypothetical protein